MPAPRKRKTLGGSSLITTLLVIVVLSIIVTAFLQSMTAERQTSRSYLNRYRAELAAQSAAEVSENLMRYLFQKYPDSCTAWATLPQTRGTVYYFRTNKGADTAALPKDHDTIDIKALMLASGAVPVVATDLSENLAFPKGTGNGDTDGLSPDNSVNFNRKSWIGGTKGNETQEIRAKWVDVLEDPSKPRNDTYDPDKGRAVNGIVARYAYWIEDDSFRVNVNTSGKTPRNDDTRGATPAEVDVQSVMATAGTDDFSEALLKLRDEDMTGRKLLSPSQINYAAKTGADDAYDKLKYYVTDTSGSLNFTRGGVKRLNLNRTVTDDSDADHIRKELDRIIAAIGNQYAIPSDSAHKSLSDFGQRFYYNYTGVNMPTAALNRYSVSVDKDFNHADIYMQKLAANIRDYIDKDSQPIIIGNRNQIEPKDEVDYSSGDYPVKKPAKPDSTDLIGFTPGGNVADESDTIAVGKESVPGLQEYALRATLISMAPKKGPKSVTTAAYEMEDSYYFEFFNPTDKPIKISDLYGKGADPAPFLMISHQVGYGTKGGNDVPSGRVIEIPLENFVDAGGQALKEFPAGKVTVLTTDPSPYADLVRAGVDVNSFYRPNASALETIKAKRKFQGNTSDKTGKDFFRLLAKLGGADGRAGSTVTDYDTHVMLGNGDGVIDSFTALPIAEALSLSYESTPDAEHVDEFRGGSLKGNLTNSTPSTPTGVASGDARSLNEQLYIRRYLAGVSSDITRFLTTNLNTPPLPGKSSIGAYFFSEFNDARLWPDYAPQDVNGASSAFARIANSKIDSIGRLGDIYDPVRNAGESGIVYSRGGGRSLRIGQSERYISGGTAAGFGLWDNKEDSISRNRAAWRLADIFATSDDTDLQGRININGVSRDDGAALKAALYKLKFGGSTSADPSLAGKQLDIDSFVTAMKQRFPSSKEGDATKDRPFWERGELSELQYDTDGIFNAGSKLAGVNMKTVLDRNREELVRRSLELISTKGNVYRTYCIGEAVTTDRNGNLRVLSRQQLKVTFSVEPAFTDPLPADDQFDGVAELADDDVTPTKRFRQPEDYRIKILSVNTL